MQAQQEVEAQNEDGTKKPDTEPKNYMINGESRALTIGDWACDQISSFV